MESGLGQESSKCSLWKARTVSQCQGVTSAECLAQGLTHCRQPVGVS